MASVAPTAIVLRLQRELNVVGHRAVLGGRAPAEDTCLGGPITITIAITRRVPGRPGGLETVSIDNIIGY